MFVPTLLAVLCGMRRGEIAALRWKNVDLSTCQLAILESAEQVGSKVRYKAPGRGPRLPSPWSWCKLREDVDKPMKGKTT